MTEDRYEAGLRARRSVLGDEHVDRALAGSADGALDADFQRYITENAWGTLWTVTTGSTAGRDRA